MNAPLSYRVLVIDDTPAIHDDFRKVFGGAVPAQPVLDAEAEAIFGDAPSISAPRTQFHIESAMQGREGAEMVKRSLEHNKPYALAFVDMRMPPGWDGLETVQQLWKIDPRLQIIICTAHSDHSWHAVQETLGSSDSLIVLKKPFDHIEALQLAQALAQKWTLGRENESRLAQMNALIRERTQELKFAEDRFSRAFEANPVAQSLIALDPFEMLEVNPAFTRQFGFTIAQLKHETPESFRRGIDPVRWRALIMRLLSGEEIDEHQYIYERGPGDTRDLRCSARLLKIGDRLCSIWIMRDVTEQVRLEQQFRQAQKMDAVGQLAAGIAHDFNNLLTVIQTYSSLILADDTPKSELVHVLDAAERAAALTRQLLVFSRREITRPEPVDLRNALQNIRHMLARLLPERIRLEWRAADSLSRAMADLTSLEQVVMNLVINARDATVGPGVITVAIEGAHVTEVGPKSHPKARIGAFVRIAISDTGTGMPPHVLARIFEPFFTTKESGKGTGLGLSTVFGIVDQHTGWIEVASEPGHGTTFQVYIPAMDTVEDAPVAPLDDQPAAPALRGPGDRLLIVEDDPTVRAAASRIARSAGYHVTEAEDGHAALRVWNDADTDFDLVFTDVEMPNGISGIDLARQLRRDKPEIKIVFTTGYSDKLVRGVAEGLGDVPLLTKPYTRTEFLEKLNTALAPAVHA